MPDNETRILGQRHYREPTRTLQVHRLLAAAGLTVSAAAAELEIADTLIEQWCDGWAKPPRWALLALEALVERGRRGE
jgi:hypothetical protein